MSVHAFSPGIRLWNYRDKFAGFTASLLFHVAMLMMGGALLIKPVEYGVETGWGGVEIQLVAAPEEAVPEAPVVEERMEEKIVVQPDTEDIPLPQPEIKPLVTQEVPKEVLTAENPAVKGDGSSPIAGLHETTFHSTAGALTEAKPNYLKNPAPVYPREARQNGWEGLVVIHVVVDKSGHPSTVAIKRSSGYTVLDEAALKAVKSWRFYPAFLGEIPVEASVHIPVRFELHKT